MADPKPQPQQTRLCRRCREKIDATFPHCPSPTCVWCRECGETVRRMRKP